MGAKEGLASFANENIRAEVGSFVLDIGCGPADLLDYLPSINYWGFDISESYIFKAKKKYGDRGNFYAKELGFEDLKMMPKFDLVIASGLLHHLDDELASHVMRISYEALKSNGRMITIDPCYVFGQNRIARYLISKDRGVNVRDEIGYKKLATKVFHNVQANIKHKSWIPYTHCIMECSK